ncbi:unnamed protein product [Owenia fusiformis]|uniref:Uncharacterized protein n=1 Tax=Owenia fusiformis TaxID=6347 RepID=A0A8J1XIQ0_OWEFU|nr:unnamed protein product [Owenia fusiformis]
MAFFKSNGFSFAKAIIFLSGMAFVYLGSLSLHNQFGNEIGGKADQTDPKKLQQVDDFEFMDDPKFKDRSLDSEAEDTPGHSKIAEQVNANKLKVIILGYKRGGTSFFGDLLHRYPNTQYLFEPLIGIYGHMYMGKVATPWAIRIHSNGTIRAIPEYEEAYAITQLHHLFNCNYQKIHPHVYTTNGPPIIKGLDLAKCISKDTNDTRFTECGRNVLINEIPNYCINPDVLPKDRDKNPYGLRFEILRRFRNFNDLLSLREGVWECRDHLQKQCQSSSAVVIKLIRSRMSTAIKLLKRDPDIKIIHLIRDPRGIQDSRRRITPGYGFIGLVNISESVGLLCKLMLNDSMTVKIQPTNIKKRILQIRYEDILLNRNTSLQTISDFLGKDDWSPLATWMDRIDCRTYKDGKKICTKGSDSMNKWRFNLDTIDQIEMANTCAEALKYFGYPKT